MERTMEFHFLRLCISLVFFGILCQTCVASIGSGQAIQIVTPVNRSFQLELNDLRTVLEANDIKDRHVTVISIAGTSRKGNSFVTNYFLRYLNAMYQKHNITDWIGDSSNQSDLSELEWRGGYHRPESTTTGIWIWSEVFTHDFENGEKLAIILLDTQGLLDNRSSLKDFSVTFALSMMLSSVQCFNLIPEDDLTNLELFVEYVRAVQQQSNEKPFHYLLFLDRWSNSDLRRDRIQTSFDEINANLMPHPGLNAATGRFEGDPEFRKYFKELTPALLAPGNLIIKKVNGKKLRARDLVQYLEEYTSIFNDELPSAQTILEATATAELKLLSHDAVEDYSTAMQKFMYITQCSLIKPSDLQNLHEETKMDSLSKFEQKQKLGDGKLIASYKQRIENLIQEKFRNFMKENDEKLLSNEASKVSIKHQMESVQEQFRTFKADIEAKLGSRDNLLQEKFRNIMKENDEKFVTNEVLKVSINQQVESVQKQFQTFGADYEAKLGSKDNLLQEKFRNFMKENDEKIVTDAASLKRQVESIQEQFHTFRAESDQKMSMFSASKNTVMVSDSSSAYRFPSAYARCPDGKKLVGGGGSCVSDIGWTFLIRSQPDDDHHTWTVACDTQKHVTSTAYVYALCQ